MSDVIEEKSRPSTWQRTTTRRFLTWQFSRRILRRELIGLAWIVSLLALYYGIVDWQGRRDWNAFRKSYEARVGSLDFQSYIPKPVPDSENFAANPIARSWCDTNDSNILFSHDAFSRAANMLGDRPKKQRRDRGFLDLVAWREAFAAAHSHSEKPKDGFRSDKLDLASRAQAAPAVLDGMKDDDAALDELRAASARPGSRYDVKYNIENPWTTPIPHLGHVKQACLRLETRACAELAAGQNESALEDVKLSFYMADSADSEPFLISYLVHIACLQITIQPVWEGLAEHRWSDAELKEIQNQLEQYNVLEDMQRPLHTECAMGDLAVELLKKRGLQLLEDFGNTPSDNKAVLTIAGKIVPSGWYDEEMAHYCQMYESEFRDAMDAPSKRVFPGHIAANAQKRNRLTEGIGPAIIHHEFLAKLMLPALARLPVKGAAAQTAISEAAVACALERYRLAIGQYPDDLQALVPRFITQLPNDVITGDPLKYRRSADGQFILYSVGWNETDDGGVPGTTEFDEAHGDWVWEYPAKN